MRSCKTKAFCTRVWDPYLSAQFQPVFNKELSSTTQKTLRAKTLGARGLAHFALRTRKPTGKTQRRCQLQITLRDRRARHDFNDRLTEMRQIIGLAAGNE